MDRRQVLAGAASMSIAGLAGCTGGTPPADEPRYALEVVVQNDHDRSYEVHTVMTDASETSVFERTFTLDPGEGQGFSDDYPAGEYTIVVELSDRSELRSSWNTAFCDAHRVQTEIGVDGHMTQHVSCHAEDGSAD